MTLQEIKKEKEIKVSALFVTCSLFFAFSNEQFNEYKTPLAEGEKYVSIGGGGYLPKGKANDFSKGMDEIESWFKSAVKDQKLRRDHIIHELVNHECWYTGDIEDALTALGDDYTAEEVWQVYKSEKENH